MVTSVFQVHFAYEILVLEHIEFFTCPNTTEVDVGHHPKICIPITLLSFWHLKIKHECDDEHIPLLTFLRKDLRILLDDGAKCFMRHCFAGAQDHLVWHIQKCFSVVDVLSGSDSDKTILEESRIFYLGHYHTFLEAPTIEHRKLVYFVTCFSKEILDVLPHFLHWESWVCNLHKCSNCNYKTKSRLKYLKLCFE